MSSQKERLISLLTTDSCISGTILAATLNVSPRQLRNYVKGINLEVPDLIMSSNKGYQLNETVYQIYLYNETHRGDNISNYTPGQRRDYITQLLLADKVNNIFDLAEECYVSVPTIEGDLQSIKKSIQNFGLDISNRNNRVIISGDELNKRKLMNSVLTKERNKHFNIIKEVEVLTQYYNFENIFSDIKDILIGHHIFANDYSISSIVLHLVIMIDRISNNKGIKNNLSKTEFSDNASYQVALAIKQYVIDKFRLNIEDSELTQLLLVIDNNTTEINYAILNRDNLDKYLSPRVIEIATFLSNKLENKFYIESLDDAFFVRFAMHIHNLLTRVQTGHSTINPFKGQLKYQNPFIYDIGVYLAHKLQQQYSITINEDEISYFAIHVGGQLQQQIERKEKLRVAFVYSEYYNLHSSMINELINVFSRDINIERIIPLHDYNPENSYDLVLTSDNLFDSHKHLSVGHFLTSKIINDINQRISEIKNEKNVETFRTIVDKFFTDELFFVEENNDFNEIEIIKWIVQKTSQKGYTNKDFLADILGREKLSSTNFNKVAIPHSLSANVDKSFIFTSLSTKNILWNGENVSLVLLVGINKNDINDFSILFDGLVELLNNPINVATLSNVRSPGEFKSLIIEFYRDSLPK